MKRVAVVGIVLVLAVVSAGAQNLSQVQDDLSTFLGGLGSDVLGQLQQNALLGQGIGDAQLGDFPHMYFTLDTGAVFTKGIATIVDKGTYQVLNMPGIVNDALSGINSSTVTNLYNSTRSFFLYPHARLSFGFGIVDGFEVLGQIAYWPQALSDAILTGATANFFNAGLRIRKVLLADSGPFPALSVGAGYVYSSFNLGYNLSKVGALTFSPITLDFSASKISLGATLHTAGIDLTVSKRLLVFVPYLTFSSWYQWGSYDASLSDLSVTIVPTTNSISPLSHGETGGLSFLISGGFAVKLGAFVLTLGGSYNPATNVPAAEAALGAQF